MSENYVDHDQKACIIIIIIAIQRLAGGILTLHSTGNNGPVTQLDCEGLMILSSD